MEAAYRHEMKYVISDYDIAVLKARLDPLMKKDSHAPGGSYLISSLYFDDYEDTCLSENIIGTDPRQKYRIRFYNLDTSYIHLECKRKERGMTLKTSCPISQEQYRQLTGLPLPADCAADEERSAPSAGPAGKLPPVSAEQPPVFNRLSVLIRERQMKPKVIVNYSRIPYVYPAGNVRITIDRNLCASTDIDQFLTGAVHQRPVMPGGYHLLEVKYDGFLPDFIYHACQLDSLTQTAYSKYALCRRFGI